MEANGNDFCSQYDLVVVFPWSEDDSNPDKPHVVEMMRRVSEAHLETFSYLSIQKDEVSEVYWTVLCYLSHGATVSVFLS